MERDSAPSTPVSARGPVGESSSARRNRARCLFLSRVLLGITYLLGIGLAGYILFVLITENSTSLMFSFAISGIFVGLSVPLALHDLNMHLMH